MDGFFIWKLGGCVVIISPQDGRYVILYHQTALRVICAAPHKKETGIALTRLATLRHNHFVRE
jgi:hypothetical protein